MQSEDGGHMFAARWTAALRPPAPGRSISRYSLVGASAPHSGVGYYVTLNPDTVTSLHTSLPPAVSAATSGARQQEVESVQVIFAH